MIFLHIHLICRSVGPGILLSGLKIQTAAKAIAWSWQMTSGPITAPQWGGELSRGWTKWGGLSTARVRFLTRTTHLLFLLRHMEISVYLCLTLLRLEQMNNWAATLRGVTSIKDSTGAGPVSLTHTVALKTMWTQLFTTKCQKEARKMQKCCAVEN